MFHYVASTPFKHPSEDTTLKDNYTDNQTNSKFIHQDTLQDTHQDTLQVTPQVMKLLSVLKSDMSRSRILEELNLKDKVNLRVNYLFPAIEQGLIEMTIPTNQQAETKNTD